MYKQIALITSLLILITSDIYAKNSRHNPPKQQGQLVAYSCYDAEDRPIHGIWNQRDAWLINLAGGSCVERGHDEADLSELYERSLTDRQIKKSLRKARKRFPKLLKNAWLVGARDIHNSSFKYTKYRLVYDNLATGKRIFVKVKQNKWTGKIKKIRANVEPKRQDYFLESRPNKRRIKSSHSRY